MFWTGIALLAVVYATAVALTVRRRVPAADLALAHAPVACLVALALGVALF